jgi:hypothetical protein
MGKFDEVRDGREDQCDDDAGRAADQMTDVEDQPRQPAEEQQGLEVVEEFAVHGSCDLCYFFTDNAEAEVHSPTREIVCKDWGT